MAAGDSVASSGAGAGSSWVSDGSSSADASTTDSATIARSISSRKQPAYWPNLALVSANSGGRSGGSIASNGQDALVDVFWR